MLKISMQTDQAMTIFELEGRLAGPWVRELESIWRQSVVPNRATKVVLKAVTFVDKAGTELLAEMHGNGIELVAEGCMNKAIIDGIVKGECK
jgi:hypothetical protein